MEYSFDIFNKTPEHLSMVLAVNCRKRRLDRGMSRRSLSEATGIPEPTLERFETKGKISLESFLKLVVEFDWFDEMSVQTKSINLELLGSSGTQASPDVNVSVYEEPS